MKKLLFFVLTLLCVIQSLFSQKILSKSVYVFYGHHFPTKYIVDSGQNNLVPRKNVFSAEIGLNLDFPIAKHLQIQTGLAGHLLFLDETAYGITGPIPDGFSENLKRLAPIYERGAEYIESVSIGVPVKLNYMIFQNKNMTYSVAGGPSFDVYFPGGNEMAGLTDQKENGQWTQAYWVTRISKNSASSMSSPQLEWDFDAVAKRSFKSYGAVSLGIKTHIGTKSLEHATFVVWPDEPNYRSKGHFTLNRSYIGVFGAFRFGKNRGQ